MPHTRHPPFLYVAYHTPELAVCCARDRIHHPDFEAHDLSQTFASVAAKFLSLTLAEHCRRNEQNCHLVATILSNLRFDDAADILENVIEAPDYTPVRQRERIVGAASDPFNER